VTIDDYHDVMPTQTDDKAYFDGHYYSDRRSAAAAGDPAYVP
jgi:hypothetical protein